MWYAGEELGLLGSTHYVTTLNATNVRRGWLGAWLVIATHCDAKATVRSLTHRPLSTIS